MDHNQHFRLKAVKTEIYFSFLRKLFNENQSQSSMAEGLAGIRNERRDLTGACTSRTNGPTVGF